MPEETVSDPRLADSFAVNGFQVDLTAGEVRSLQVPCRDLEDVLGGVARAVRTLGGLAISDAYSPDAPLVVNLGILSGTRVMTGLRTFIHGYSPLKTSLSGAPGLMWSAGSGDFGTKLRGLGVDEITVTGRALKPTLLRITPGHRPDGPGLLGHIELLDAADLVGVPTNDRIQLLHRRFPEAHFAVIGPAGDHWDTVRFASVALSTDSQLTSGDAKPRFCARGGFGGVMGSKNLLALVADGPNPRPSGEGLKELNREINLGRGSLPYREDGGGGTWRHVKAQHDVGGLPEFNFHPQGTQDGIALARHSVEAGPYIVKAEGCHLCGIRCHKNVYDDPQSAPPGRFRGKVDYEPWALLSSNLGIYEPSDALNMVRLADELGLDAISLGVTLSLVMEHNRRNPTRPIADGLAYGDVEATRETIRAVGEGRLPDIGQGSLRLARKIGGMGYAMQSKGVEYPAYLPHTNPGYPWALSGGHTSMGTVLLTMIERQTDVDFWVDAITNRGPMIMLDDITGLCQFARLDPDAEAQALRHASGLAITGDDLRGVVRRTYLRGYASERRQGFTEADYTLPAEAHVALDHSKLPQFNTPQFFAELQQRVMAVLDARAQEAGFLHQG
jgi:aldehyde:ferredoxin oxidoreductase